MEPALNRRSDMALARIIDHAVAVACTHGWRYAAHYLENHGVNAAIVRRVIMGDGSARAGGGCPTPWFGVPAREREREFDAMNDGARAAQGRAKS